MPTNVYFTQGTAREQFLVEDLIIESLKIYGKEFYYIPRTLVAKDDILGEDVLSRFKNAYGIEMYIEDIDGFGGQGVFLQKFGIQIEKSATFVVARKRWEQSIGKWNTTLIPSRPAEGDLLFFPMTATLFEIKFVENQDPFYQLGNLYVYKLRAEIFRYSQEQITTGIPEIDDIEDFYSINILNYKIINEDEQTAILLESSVAGDLSYIIDESYNTDEIEPFANNDYMEQAKANAMDFTEQNPFGEI
jgi:hypothetical protein